MNIIEKIKKKYPGTFMQFIKFGLVGISNTAISLAVYYIFLWINHSLYLVGSIVGFIVSVANSFFGIINMFLKQKGKRIGYKDF